MRHVWQENPRLDDLDLEPCCVLGYIMIYNDILVYLIYIYILQRFFLEIFLRWTTDKDFARVGTLRALAGEVLMRVLGPVYTG